MRTPSAVCLLIYTHLFDPLIPTVCSDEQNIFSSQANGKDPQGITRQYRSQNDHKYYTGKEWGPKLERITAESNLIGGGLRVGVQL